MNMTTSETAGATATRSRSPATVSFTANDITAFHTATVDDIPADALAGDVALTVANRLNLPTNVPWSLRDNVGPNYLRADVQIGQQIPAAGAKLTLTPRTHLG
jgi:hypothetical protein